MPRQADVDDAHLLELFEVVGQRWTLHIVWALRSGPLTYRQLAGGVPGLSTSVLSARLRELKAADLIQHDGAGYALTRRGNDLLTQLRSLRKWAQRVEFRSNP